MQILIVGAGAYGIAAAWALQARGHAVTVLESGLFASGATPLAAGLISRQGKDATGAALVDDSQRFFEALGHAYTGNMEVRVDGMLRLAFSSATAATLEGETRQLAAAGFPIQLLTRTQAEALAPAMNLNGLLAADYDPRAAYGDPYGYLYIASAILASKGVQFRLRAPVQRLLQTGARVTGVALAGGEELRAEWVVLAAGAGCKAIMRASGLPLPVKAHRVQAAILDLGWFFPVIGHDLDSGLYFRREGNTHLLVAGGAEPVESDPDAWNPKAGQPFLDALPERLTDLIPTARDAGLMRGWAGLCAVTPDRRPLLGPYPDLAGLAVLTGDNGYGFSCAPALGEACAQIVLGETPRYEMNNHLLSRYRDALGRAGNH